MKYIKQLDSLRAIAVILVIISHWIPATSVINRMPNGIIGVNIFFVLSGFLISKILFEQKNNAELLDIPKSILIKNFYVRRTLRIFPIYYLTIFLLLIFSKSTGANIQVAFKYLITYTANIYFFRIQTWDGMISHLWSLAVEEQFYLIWPWVILFCNKKYFIHIITAFILVGIVSQYLMRDIKMNNVLTFTCFDAFGFGAFLAWVAIYSKENLYKFYLTVSAVTAVIILLLSLGATQQFPLRTMISFIALWLITYIIISLENDSLKFKFILNNKILIFLGKISYGLYLYHTMIPSTVNAKIVNKYLNPLLPDFLYKKHWEQLFFLENALLLITISWLSFVLIEKRFLALKKYFDY